METRGPRGGRRSRRVRSALHARGTPAVRSHRRRSPAVDGRAPGQAVRALVVEPYRSVADAHERLDALERTFREHGDRRGAFLVVYARVTGAVGHAIADDAFADPEWVAAYLVAFADRYREAVLANETGVDAALPAAWRVAFEAADRGDSVTQAALLGINAHVNYDLAFALDDVGVTPSPAAKYADHCAVNDVLRSLVDDVQDLLAARYAPGVADLDESLGRADETLGYLSLAQGRDSAWRSALALNSRWRTRRRLARWVLHATSTGTAHLILAPTHSDAVSDRLHAAERAHAHADGPDAHAAAGAGRRVAERAGDGTEERGTDAADAERSQEAAERGQ